MFLPRKGLQTVAQVRYQNKLLNIFKPPGGKVGIYRYSATRFFTYYHVRDNYYAYFQHETRTGLSQIIDSGFSQVLQMINQDNATYVAKTGTWTNGSGGNAWGGNFFYATVANATVTFTSSTADATTIGFVCTKLTNSGVAEVFVDSDNTLANQLPTAQSLVDSGALANTVLIANGGTLAPTARVYDSYSATTGWMTMVNAATGLTPGTHTIQLRYTGYKNTAATGTIRFEVEGFFSTSATARIDTGTPYLQNIITLGNSGSVTEYAIMVNGTLIGNGHGNEAQDSLSITVDGVTTTVNNLQLVVGTEVIITRTGHLTHPDYTGNVGTTIMTYKINASGFTLHPRITWVQAGSASNSYLAMMCFASAKMPLVSNAGCYGTQTRATDYDLQWVQNAASHALMVHSDGGTYAALNGYGALLYCPNLAYVSNYQSSFIAQLAVEYRFSQLLVKVYQTRVYNVSINFLVNDVWENECVHMYYLGDVATLTTG